MLKDRFNFIREKYGLNKAEFARRIGVSATYITDLESGKREKISQTLAMLISWEFGFSTEWILTGKEPMVIEEEINQALKNKLYNLRDKLALKISESDLLGEKRKEGLRQLDEYEERILLLLQGMDEDRKKKVLEMIEKESLLMTLLQKQGTIMTMVEERETEKNPLCEENNHDV